MVKGWFCHYRCGVATELTGYLLTEHVCSVKRVESVPRGALRRASHRQVEEEKIKMDFECSVSEYLISENIKVKTHLKRSLFVMLKTDNQTAHRGAYSHLLMKMLLK